MASRGLPQRTRPYPSIAQVMISKGSRNLAKMATTPRWARTMRIHVPFESKINSTASIMNAEFEHKLGVRTNKYSLRLRFTHFKARVLLGSQDEDYFHESY